MVKSLIGVATFIWNHPLTRRHRIAALMQFFRWQIAARLSGVKMVVPWVDNAKFVSGVGETALTGNIYAGLIEFEDMMFLLHALQPDETFVDVGANVGAYTVLASKVVGAKSISFEPLPDTVDRLIDQIQLNRIGDRVSVRNNGVGDRCGELFFTNNNDTINKVSLSGETTNTTKVPVVALDGDLDPNQKYFFKIDVEGFEFNVLEGSKKILGSDQVSALIIELNGSGEGFGHSNNEIHAEIVRLGFEPVRYDPFARILMPIDGYNGDGGNTIYVKNRDLIQSRCRLAPKHRIHTAQGISL